MNKKKTLIIFITLIFVISAIITTVIVITNGDDEVVDNNLLDHSVKVTGKLQQYIANMGENYYIKYSGTFKDVTEKQVKGIVEYTKSGESFALRSTELDMYLICEKDTLYSISHRYKLMINMSKESFNINEYNLVSNIGQVFVNTYKEQIDNTEHDVEEYQYNGKQLKYYFKEDNIRLIKYDGQEIRIIRFENKSNLELLTKPTGYKGAETVETSYMQIVETEGDK